MPDGTMVLAPLPAGVIGHFGPELCRFVLAQYHQGQVTVPRLVAQLRGGPMAAASDPFRTFVPGLSRTRVGNKW